MATSTHESLRLEQSTDASGATLLRLAGRLDTDSSSSLWSAAGRVGSAADLVIDVSDLTYCNGAGAALLAELVSGRGSVGVRASLRGSSEDLARLLEMVTAPPADRDAGSEDGPDRRGRRAQVATAVERWGRAVYELASSTYELIAFTGQLTVALLAALRRPWTVRWADAFGVAAAAGIAATPIMALVGLLLGVILAFQSAIPMQQFGAQVFVADLLGISVLRELGALMAAILLTARSGSAFAAELGTMTINEEIDALRTMGLEPVRFLIVPRVLAAVSMVPVLTVMMDFFILTGGAIVFSTLGYPLVTYVRRIADAATVADFAGGLGKAVVFGTVVAAVGCLRGLQTGSDAGAVGASATSAVVSGIILIAIVDGVFAFIFYTLGI